MERRNFKSGSLTLSYLDSGGDAPAIIALHAHWMEAQTFASFAHSFGSEWRVVGRKQILRADISRYKFLSLDPHDNPLAIVIHCNSDAYALDLSVH